MSLSATAAAPRPRRSSRITRDRSASPPRDSRTRAASGFAICAAEVPLLTADQERTLAERIARYPTRFRGFAAVPMQDPREAADELERAVKELGFKGALINGHTQGVYLDDARCLPFWERVAALDVPNPMMIPAAFEGYPGLAQSIFG